MATVNGIHYPVGSDTYDLPADFLEHAQTDAQQAQDAASAVGASVLAEAIAYADSRVNYVPALAAGTNLNNLTGVISGGGTWRTSGADVTNGPPGLVGAAHLVGYRVHNSAGHQMWITAAASMWWRTQTAGTWSAWERIDKAAVLEAANADILNRVPRLPVGQDLNTLTAAREGTGTFRALGSQVENAPPGITGEGILHAYRMNSTTGVQEWTTNSGGKYQRRQFSSDPWTDWIPLMGGTGEVRVFATITDAQAWEAYGPGRVGLYIAPVTP